MASYPHSTFFFADEMEQRIAVEEDEYTGMEGLDLQDSAELAATSFGEEEEEEEDPEEYEGAWTPPPLYSF